jgi:DNA mismatch endonuclease (patch repair protein)
MDRIPAVRRSWLMARVTSKNTGPERALRRILTGLGYRYRLHICQLPGKPDIAFRSRRKAIFIHGCFWHQHEGCPKGRLPKSRQDYWGPKLARNGKRDAEIMDQMTALGWSVMIVWQCELRNGEVITERLAQFLGPPPHAERGTTDAALAASSAFVIGQYNRRSPMG